MLPSNIQPLLDLGFTISKNEHYLILGKFKVYESPLKNDGNVVFDADRFDSGLDFVSNFVSVDSFVRYFKSLEE